MKTLHIPIHVALFTLLVLLALTVGFVTSPAYPSTISLHAPRCSAWELALGLNGEVQNDSNTIMNLAGDVLQADGSYKTEYHELNPGKNSFDDSPICDVDQVNYDQSGSASLWWLYNLKDQDDWPFIGANDIVCRDPVAGTVQDDWGAEVVCSQN